MRHGDGRRKTAVAVQIDDQLLGLSNGIVRVQQEADLIYRSGLADLNDGMRDSADTHLYPAEGDIRSRRSEVAETHEEQVALVRRMRGVDVTARGVLDRVYRGRQRIDI